jgi:hypothetical protein
MSTCALCACEPFATETIVAAMRCSCFCSGSRLA